MTTEPRNRAQQHISGPLPLGFAAGKHFQPNETPAPSPSKEIFSRFVRGRNVRQEESDENGCIPSQRYQSLALSEATTLVSAVTSTSTSSAPFPPSLSSTSDSNSSPSPPQPGTRRSKSARRRIKEKLTSKPLPKTPPPDHGMSETVSLNTSGSSRQMVIMTDGLSGVEIKPNRAESVSTRQTLHLALESSSPSQVYANLCRYVTERASNYNRFSNEVLTKFPEAPLSIVHGILESFRYRDKLLEILNLVERLEDTNDLSYADHRFQQALQKDGKTVISLLTHVVSSPEETSIVLHLRGEDAEVFMDALQDVIHSHTHEERSKSSTPVASLARKLLISLSKLSTDLPEDLFISGVDIVNDRNSNIVGGMFGDIFRSNWQGKPVALKRLRVFQNSDRGKVYRKFCKEALIWRRLESHYILPFYGVDVENFPRQPCMVSPWCANGTIIEFLKRMEGKGKVDVDQLLYGIAQGIEYLHSQKIVHGDIKGANILIDDQLRPLLADFGLTIFADLTRGASTDQGGTMRYMAPELLFPDLNVHGGWKRTPRSDIYSFGCVCIEIYTLRVPFSDLAEVLVLQEVRVGGRPSRPEGMKTSLWRLVQECWQHNALLRPSGADVARTLREIVSRHVRSSTGGESANTEDNRETTAIPARDDYDPIPLLRFLPDPTDTYQVISKHPDSNRFFAVRCATNTVVSISQLDISKTKHSRHTKRLINHFIGIREKEHLNLLRYTDVFFYTPSSVWFVMDFLPVTAKTLMKVVSVPENLAMGVAKKEGFVRVVSKQVLKAVRFLHANGIVHGDIRADRVVVRSDLEPVRFQLAFPEMELSGSYIQPQHDARRCPPPEHGRGSLVEEGECTEMTDIWDIGVLALDMFDPHQSIEIDPCDINSVYTGLNLQPGVFISYLARVFNEAENRPSAKALIKDPFFSESR